MAESGSRHGRPRDAQRARKAILDAAEAVFAQHGFDGARIDAIAKASGYNTSLLFQYFGESLKQVDQVNETCYTAHHGARESEGKISADASAAQ